MYNYTKITLRRGEVNNRRTVLITAIITFIIGIIFGLNLKDGCMEKEAELQQLLTGAVAETDTLKKENQAMNQIIREISLLTGQEESTSSDSLQKGEK